MSFGFGGSDKKTKSSSTTKASSDTTAASSTSPWGPTQGYIENLLGRLDATGSSLGALSPGQTAAFGELGANAGKAGQFTPDIEALTRDLFATESTSPMARDAYGQLQTQLGGFASGAGVNPMDDPAFKTMIDTIADDAANRTNSMFAGAGRDLSPSNSQATARGVTQATAPILVGQYNTNIGRQFDAAKSLFGAGQETAGNVANLDAQANAQRTQGITTAMAAVDSMNLPANIRLQIETQMKNMPVEELAPMVQYLTTIAGLGQETAGTQSTVGTQKQTGTQKQSGTQWGIGLDIGEAISGALKPVPG